MKTTSKGIDCRGTRLSIKDDNDKEIGRAYLYVMQNDLHDQPFGLLEDVLIDSDFRGNGLGTQLVEMVIAEAKKLGCYKLIATSRNERPKVHKLYEELGFARHGIEFRMEL